MEPDDLIFEWLDLPYESGRGFHTIKYGPNAYIVLEVKMGYRPKYLGWFAISDSLVDNNQYEFCRQKEGMYLYRCKADSYPEQP